jgi:hypothetical protein
MMKNKKELLKSPRREWNDTDKEYDAILLVPDGTKHDSGYMHIAVIGVTRGKDFDDMSFEICAYPDDISCHFPIFTFGDNKEFSQPLVRMDCYYPQGVLQYHGRGKFKVGMALSSVGIYFTPEKKS